jgi:hypothetical protein
MVDAHPIPYRIHIGSTGYGNRIDIGPTATSYTILWETLVRGRDIMDQGWIRPTL